MSSKYAEYETGLDLFRDTDEPQASAPEIIKPIGEPGLIEVSKNPGSPSEDAALVDNKHMVYGVFDGVGGSDAGAEASQIARDAFHDRLTTPRARDILDNPDASDEQVIELLINTTNLANAEIARYVAQASLEAGKNIRCQTTATVVVVKQTPGGPKLMGINIGDSRALIDPAPENHPDRSRQQRDIAERTKDGALQKPDIYYELATDDSRGNIINDALDGTNRTRPPQIINAPLKKDSRLLLMSDGVSGDWANGDITFEDKATNRRDYFEDETQFKTQDELNKYFDRSRSPQQVAIEMAEDSRKHDDITAIVVDFGTETSPVELRSNPKINKKSEKLQKKHLKDLDKQLLTAGHRLAKAIVGEDQPAIDAVEEAYIESHARHFELASQGLSGDDYEQYAVVYGERENERLSKLIGAYRYVEEDQDGRYRVNERGDIVEKKSATAKRWLGKLGIGAIAGKSEVASDDDTADQITIHVMPQPAMPAAELPVAALEGMLGPEHAYEFVQDPATGAIERKPGAAGRLWQASKGKTQAAYGMMLGAKKENSEESSDTKEDDKKRKYLVFGALAAVAGVVAVTAASKYGFDIDLPWNDNNGPRPDTAAPSELPSDPLPTPDEPGNGNGGENGGTGQGNGNPDYDNNRRPSLSSGETIWAEAEQALGPNASTEDIDRVKDAILINNGISEHQATQLPTGYRFSMPVELIEELTREAEKAKTK